MNIDAALAAIASLDGTGFDLGAVQRAIARATCNARSWTGKGSTPWC